MERQGSANQYKQNFVVHAQLSVSASVSEVPQLVKAFCGVRAAVHANVVFFLAPASNR